MMKSELSEPTIKLSLFHERQIRRKDGNGPATSVVTFIPISIGCDGKTGMIVKDIVNSTIVESVMAYLEQITDSRTVQALEFHLNRSGTSLARLCKEPDKISKAIYEIFGEEGARPVIDAIVMISYRTIGLKCCSSNAQTGQHTHDNLAQSLIDLRKLVLEQGNQQ